MWDKQGRFLRSLMMACCMLAALYAQAQTRNFDVAAGDLKTALDTFIAQSQAQLLYKVDDVKGLSTKGAKGAATPEEALARLLEGTKLKIRRDADGAMVIYVAPPDALKSERTDQPPANLSSVVVTASRRHEPAREVPMQVSARSGEALERAGAKSLTDYIADEPGVNLSSYGGTRGGLSMRGVTTGNQQTVATVGVYVDDVPVGSSSATAGGSTTALDMGLLDLHHIEILRGPQGTLYGAGAMGGLLKYVTTEPDTGEFSGKVTLGTSSVRGGGNNATVSAVLNVPLKQDVAGLRVAAFQDQVAGYYKAVGAAAGDAINAGDTKGLRLSLLVTPTSKLSVRLSATTQNLQRDGHGMVDMDLGTGQPIEGDLSRRRTVADPVSNRLTLYGLDLEYDLGWARLNSITSSQEVKDHSVIDASPVYVPLLNANGLPAVSTWADDSFKQDRISQEFRLTSRASNQLEWLAGAFFSRERGAHEQTVDAGFGGALSGANLLTGSVPSTYLEQALYGDLTWHATRLLSLTAGARVARNSQTVSQSASGLLLGQPSVLGGSSEDSSTTYLATAQYALAPTSNVYFRAASGYRPGGPNGVPLSTGLSPVPPSFQSDSLWSYELGYKADLLDKTLSLQAALFDIEWSNLQQVVVIGGFGSIVNAGDARVRGSELALNWSPLPALRLSAAATTLDARLRSDAPGLAASGTRLPNSARFSGSLGASYNFNVAAHPSYLGVTVRHVGERDAGYPGSAMLPSFKMPAYSSLDLQAGIELGRFSLAAYVRNLTDQRGLLSATHLTGNLEQVTVTQPRSVGVSLSTSF